MSHSLAIPLSRVAAVVSKQQQVQPVVPKKAGGNGGRPKQVQREGVMDPFAN